MGVNSSNGGLISPDICHYWDVQVCGIVSAKIDEQKTEDTRQKMIAIIKIIIGVKLLF